MNAITGFLKAMAPFMAAAVVCWGLARAVYLWIKKQSVNWYHETALLLYLVFIAGLVSQTVLPPSVSGLDGAGRSHETWLIPFRFVCYTYEDMFVRHSSYSLLINVLGNIVMFIPVGFFPPLLWRLSGKWAVAAGFFSSLFIELIQLMLPRSTDIDDVILNTAGTALGFFIYWLINGHFGNFSEKFKV